ncbi:MAG TPA: XrtA system polysaccharide chain length determinant [Vicinamibacteria bacterium]|nr:XrtA system polysaccharide chain length determinant [Vicinamibacteria bacterium]
MTDRFDERAAPGFGPDLALEAWHRRKWFFVVAFTGALAAAVSGTLSLPSLYRATATVLVERQQVSEAFVRPSVTAELETRIQTIQQKVMSRERLSELVTRLGLYPELRAVEPMDAVVERMRREVSLALRGAEQTSGRNATIAFALSYTGRDPRTVAQVANTLAGFYVEENRKSREGQAARTAGFLRAQLAEAKRELDEKERRTRAFHSRYGGELPDQTAVNLATLERLNTQLRLNGEHQIRAMERRELLEARLAADGSGPAAAPSDTPEAQLLTLRQELAELRRQYSDRYPDVVRVRAAIAALEEDIAQGRAGGGSRGPALDPVQRLRQGLREAGQELESLKEEEASLRRLLAQYDARIENAPRRQQELQQLTREYDVTNERYQTLLKRYEEAQLAESLEQGHDVEQFRLLDPALPPARPAAPNRPWLLLMGLLASVALGVGSIVAAEKLDTTFHSVDDLRAFTAMPVLATIPLIPTAAGTRRQRIRVALTAVAAGLGLVVIVAGSYYVASGNEQIVRLTVRSSS